MSGKQGRIVWNIRGHRGMGSNLFPLDVILAHIEILNKKFGANTHWIQYY